MSKKKIEKIVELQQKAKEIYKEIDELMQTVSKLQKKQWVLDDRLYYIVDNKEKLKTEGVSFKVTAVKEFELKNKKA